MTHRIERRDELADGTTDGTVFLREEPADWRLALGGECDMSWKTVAQGRGEAAA
jgi:hypothetical protein